MVWVVICLLVCVPLASSVALYEQCGGEGYHGSAQCNWPLQCFRRSRWFSSCQASCPGVDWECGAAEGYANGNGVRAQPWEQCGGEGWKGAIGCVQYPCQPRSQWYSQCRPDCPAGWMCSNLVTAPAPSTVAPSTPSATTPAGEDDILDEEVTDEDLEDLELYDPDDYLDEEMETDDFPDPAEHNLDEIQQKDEELNGEFEAEDASLTRRRRNTGNIGVLDISFE